MPEIAVSSNTAYDSSWKVWIRGESVFVESWKARHRNDCLPEGLAKSLLMVNVLCASKRSQIQTPPRNRH